MRLVFLGSPPFGTSVLRHLLGSGHEVAAVVTRPDRPRGRGRSVRLSEVAAAARDAGCELLQPASTKEAGFLETLGALDPEVLVVASFGEILREDLLELAPHGALNVHASLLPRWRGAAPIQRAILSGDRTTGVSIQRMVLALDEGDVLLERRTEIGEEETSGELLARLAELGGGAIVEALDSLAAGTAVFTPQDPELVTYARKLKKEDGIVPWTRTAQEIALLVRAMTPWPGARTTLPDGRELVLLAVRADESIRGEPGEVQAQRSALQVAAGEGSGGLELLRVKPAGRGAMDGADFLRGARLEPGARLGAAGDDDREP